MHHLLGKFVHLLLVVLAVTMLTFVMTDRLPADIAAEIAGMARTRRNWRRCGNGLA